MPPLPAVNKVVKVDFIHQYGADNDVMSRMFFSYATTAPSNADLATWGAAIGLAWSDNCAALAAAEIVALSQTNLVDLTSDTSASAEVATNYGGTRTGSSLTADSCAVVGYSMARRYRGGHPRGYWPFGVEGDLNSPGSWESGFVSAVSTGVNDMVTDIIAAAWAGAGAIHQVNVSYYTGFTVVISPTTGRARNLPTPRVTPLQNNIIDSVCRVRIGSQRRRLRTA
jgi:hypothetical protein